MVPLETIEQAKQFIEKYQFSKVRSLIEESSIPLVFRFDFISIVNDLVANDSIVYNDVSKATSAQDEIDKLLPKLLAIFAELESLSQYVVNEKNIESISSFDSFESFFHALFSCHDFYEIFKLISLLIVSEKIVPYYLEPKFKYIEAKYTKYFSSHDNTNPSQILKGVEYNTLRKELYDLFLEVKKTVQPSEATKEKQKQIENTAATYVEESIKALSKRESQLKIQAIIWYIFGLFSIFAGIIIAVVFIQAGAKELDKPIAIVFLIIKSLFIIALLIAGSHYSFNLGKTYMNESLKNADRIHAISFGKFYLQVFGTEVTQADLKEVFKDWNMNQESPFLKQNPKDWDPQLVDMFTKFVDAINSFKKKE